MVRAGSSARVVGSSHHSEELILEKVNEADQPAVFWAEALAGVRLADSAARAARRMSRLEALRRVMRAMASGVKVLWGSRMRSSWP
jgi:hypothetical protein